MSLIDTEHQYNVIRRFFYHASEIQYARHFLLSWSNLSAIISSELLFNTAALKYGCFFIVLNNQYGC